MSVAFHSNHVLIPRIESAGGLVWRVCCSWLGLFTYLWVSADYHLIQAGCSWCDWGYSSLFYTSLNLHPAGQPQDSHGYGTGAKANKPNCASAFQNFVCMTFANIPLVKVSHTVQLRFRVSQYYTVTWQREQRQDGRSEPCLQCITLNEVRYLSDSYWPFGYLLLRHGCSSPSHFSFGLSVFILMYRFLFLNVSLVEYMPCEYLLFFCELPIYPSMMSPEE